MCVHSVVLERAEAKVKSILKNIFRSFLRFIQVQVLYFYFGAENEKLSEHFWKKFDCTFCRSTATALPPAERTGLQPARATPLTCASDMPQLSKAQKAQQNNLKSTHKVAVEEVPDEATWTKS
ncbi:hypothetical protein C8R45DRAFT_1079847 [Mycena sanguinolenta]|nr:hypothetical protein C8R45DRAFT_1079847 [Mycena sanguinolenta]